MTEVSFERIAENIESDLPYFHKKRWIKRAAELRAVVRQSQGEEQLRAKQALREHYADEFRPETSRRPLLEEAARIYGAKHPA